MKGIVFLFCIAIMLIGNVHACASAPYRAELPEGKALVTDSGVFVVEPGTFEDILVIEPGKIYLAGNGGCYRLIDESGNSISDIEVTMARYDGEVIIFRKDGMYGAMDVQGSILIEPVWTQLLENGSGGFIALEDSPFDNVADEIIYIGDDGAAMPSGNYTVGTLVDVSENRMPYMTSHGSFGYADEKGMTVTEPLWLYAGSFENGAAIVEDANGMGLIDTEGEAILACSYTYIARNTDLIAALSQDGMLEVYASDGKRLLFSTDAEGYSVLLVGNCVALTDQKSSKLFAKDGRCIYTGSGNASFSEGLNRQIIVSDGIWGEECVWIIDPNGKAVSEKYQQILPLEGNRYAFLSMHGAVYFSEELNDFQHSWNYESIRYGMLDGEGREILPPEYLEILGVEDDRFILVNEVGTHMTDESGNIIRSWFVPEKEDTIFG